MASSSWSSTSTTPSRSSSRSALRPEPEPRPAPQSPYNGTSSEIQPLTYDCDYPDWCRKVKGKLRERNTVEYIEYGEGSRIPETKKEKAARAELIKKETKYLWKLLSPKVSANVSLFPSTTTTRQLWHAIRKEMMGMSIAEQYAMLGIFQKLSDTAYISAEEFLYAMDDRWEHLERHFTVHLDPSHRFVTAVLGIQKHYLARFPGFQKSLANGEITTYEELKNYILTETETDCSIFDTASDSEDLKPKSRRSSNKHKIKSW
ncbi:Uncharacterized protein LW93_14835 [Fusarium fujikuroi]|nr:Uncharacterized protein LW93_14835 [Fusarium fujikuroi]